MTEWDWIHQCAELKSKGNPFALCTVCSAMGSFPREVGAKMIVTAGQKILGTIGGGNLEYQVIKKAVEAIDTGKSQKLDLSLGASVGQCCGGKVEILIDVIGVPPKLYIFGAGHVGQAVCSVMDGTGFQVHLIDDRDNIFPPDLPSAVTRHPCAWDEFSREAEWSNERTFAVVMTHEHTLDEAIIADICERKARYIGLIGSHSKWTRFKSRYEQKGLSLEKFERVHCPIGVGNFGKEPKSIAVSLAAELLSLNS